MSISFTVYVLIIAWNRSYTHLSYPFYKWEIHKHTFKNPIVWEKQKCPKWKSSNSERVITEIIERFMLLFCRCFDILKDMLSLSLLLDPLSMWIRTTKTKVVLDKVIQLRKSLFKAIPTGGERPGKTGLHSTTQEKRMQAF